MKIAEVLNKAADLIEPEGAWAQGMSGLFDPSGPCCAVGAIGRALGFQSVCRTEDWIDDNATPFLGMDAADLETWNDRHRREQPQVVTKLRKAAAKAREQGL